MKAIVFQGKGQPIEVAEIPKLSPKTGHSIVHLKAAALNHRDVWISKGMYPGLQPGVTLGSDGAGTVDGRPVIINPSWFWGNDERFPGKDFQILGMPIDGTFAEQILVPSDRLFDKPEHLDFEQAAALPLAGLTAYRVLFSRCQLKPGEKVLISGIGGGAALFAFQFAIAAGAEVWVTSSSEEKINEAMKMGAKGGANYREENWAKTFGKKAGAFDVIIDSAGGSGFANLVKLTAPGARIGLYGGTRGAWEGVSPQLVFYRQINILGSTMGSDNDFANMLSFVSEYEIFPVVDSVYPLDEAGKAFGRMDEGKQFGKIVLKIN